MKKVSCLLLTLIISFMISGCAVYNSSSSSNKDNNTASTQKENNKNEDQIVEVDYQKLGYTEDFRIFVDKETKVMYLLHTGNSGRESMSVMYNADGIPKLYNGDLPKQE